MLCELALEFGEGARALVLQLYASRPVSEAPGELLHSLFPQEGDGVAISARKSSRFAGSAPKPQPATVSDRARDPCRKPKCNVANPPMERPTTPSRTRSQAGLAREQLIACGVVRHPARGLLTSDLRGSPCVGKGVPAVDHNGGAGDAGDLVGV